jgi:predicted dehydrogenase
MEKQFTVAILGCGSRGAIFTKHMLNTPKRYKIVALCDPDRKQIEKMHNLYGLKEVVEYLDDKAFLAAPRAADLLVIASPDREHV